MIGIAQSKGNLNDLTSDLTKENKLPVFDNTEIEQFKSQAEEAQNQQITDLVQIVDQNLEENKMKASDKRKLFKHRTVSYDDMNEKSSINIDIPEYTTIREGNMGSKAYTKYQIISHVHNIPLLENNSKYTVWRKFSDFEWFHNFIQTFEEFKKVKLPPLPEKSLFTRNDKAYIEKTKK